MAIDSARIEAAIADILVAIGEDATRPGLTETPARVAQAYTEFFSGVGVDPTAHLHGAVALAPHQRGELVLVKGIEFRSMCEHHLLPFLGVAHVAYIPRDRAVGLGALARVVETVAARPQLQERLGEEIADALADGLDAVGALVIIDAVHQCVTARGPRQTGASIITMATRGELADPARRAEVLTMVGTA